MKTVERPDLFGDPMTLLCDDDEKVAGCGSDDWRICRECEERSGCVFTGEVMSVKQDTEK